MNISLTRALRDLWLPQNRLATLMIPIVLGSATWLVRKFFGGAAEIAISLLNVGYSLQAIRDFHRHEEDTRLPPASALFTGLPLCFSFCLANLPHLGVMMLLGFSILILGSKAWMGAGLWLVGCYFLAWMFAYDALAINFTRHLQLGDALNLKKAFSLIAQARSPYFQATLLPFILVFPIFWALGYLDKIYGLGGLPLLPGLILSQLSILWNLTAVKQWMRLLQPSPPEKLEPGLNPS
ncbi:MAG: hypothetical protein J0I12_18195 [Candidatus Eremiobacteraeota bacterium]|nr:hypothetical protein [Candidatus Eremiobacteraeota bacterium]